MKRITSLSGSLVVVIVALGGITAKVAALGGAVTDDDDKWRQVAAARAAVEKAAAAETEARTRLEQQTAADKTADDKTATAETAAKQAAADRQAAEKAVAELAAADTEARSEAQKELALKTAAAEKAAESAAYNKAIADRERRNRSTAEEALAKKTRSLNAALGALAEAEAAALGGLKPLSSDAWDYDKARHLLARAGFGGTHDEVDKLHAMGLYRAVEFLVDYHEQPGLMLPFDAVRPERPRPEDRLRDAKAREAADIKRFTVEQQQIDRLRGWWFQRMLQSQRPLQEKLTLFWHGHFATEYRTVGDSYAVFKQNELLREHAGGNFAVLLQGIIHDPAMLRYLDNNSNFKGHPNENLAREIMELFSMGEGQGYTEQDIMEGARALTGYTFDPATMQFRFISARHDPDTKTIFGRSGNWVGEDFVEAILQQPATARFIARKLFRYFAYDNPEPVIVNSLASVLRQREYDLGPMLKNLFRSEEFYGPRAMGTQIKCPVQLVVGLFRELGVKDVESSSLAAAARTVGQELFDPPNVKGWDGGRSWINANTVTTRYNVLADLAQPALSRDRQNVRDKRDRGIDLVTALEGTSIQSPSDVVDYMVKCLFAVPIASEKREQLVSFLGDLPPSDQWQDQRDDVNKKLRTLLILMLTMPEYQMT